VKGFAAFVSRDDRLACVGKREEERVTLRVDLDATVANERVSQSPPVLGECLRVRLGPEIVQQLRRALDVGEHEGNGSDRKIVPHCRHHHARARSRASMSDRLFVSRRATSEPGFGRIRTPQTSRSLRVAEAGL
jgi:hypothetical protein